MDGDTINSQSVGALSVVSETLKVEQATVVTNSKSIPYALSPGQTVIVSQNSASLDGYSALLNSSPQQSPASSSAGAQGRLPSENAASVEFSAGASTEFQQQQQQQQQHARAVVSTSEEAHILSSSGNGADVSNFSFGAMNTNTNSERSNNTNPLGGMSSTAGSSSTSAGLAVGNAVASNHILSTSTSSLTSIQYSKPASAPSPTVIPFSPGPATSRQPASVPPFSPAMAPGQGGGSSVTAPSQPSGSAPAFQQPRPAMYPPPQPTSSSPAVIPQQQQQQQSAHIQQQQAVDGLTGEAAPQGQNSSHSIIKNMADIVNRVPDQCGLVSALSKVEHMHKQTPGIAAAVAVGSASSSVSSALSPGPSISSPLAHLIASSSLHQNSQIQQQQQQQQPPANSSTVTSTSAVRPSSRPSSIGATTIQSPQQVPLSGGPASVKAEQQGQVKANGSNESLQWSSAVNVPQQQQPMVHVFDSKLANDAAQAVRQGSSPNIIEFHMKLMPHQQAGAGGPGVPPQPSNDAPPSSLPPNTQSSEQSGLTSQQLSARHAKLKQIEDMRHELVKKEKASHSQGPPVEGPSIPPGLPGMQHGMFPQQSIPGPNSPGMMPGDAAARMRHDHQNMEKRRAMMGNMPPEAFGPGGPFPPHMMPPQMHPDSMVDPNGCVFDPQTGMVFRPPHIASPGGPRYPSPFPPGFPGGPQGNMPPGPILVSPHGQPPPGFPMGMMPGPPPQSGRPNGPSGDQPPTKKPKRATKKSKANSENKASSLVAANNAAINNAAMAAAHQHQHHHQLAMAQQHQPRLQTVPSPRQLSALAEIDAQELIITRQLNAAYRDDLGNAEQQGLMPVHSPMSMHQIMQQQQQQQPPHNLRLPPNSMYGQPGPGQRGPESGRLSHGSMQPPPGKPMDPFVLQQQQQQELMLHQQRIAQMGGDPSMMPPNMPFDNGPPSQQFMIPPDQMSSPQMINPGYPSQQQPPHSAAGHHGRMPQHIGNVHIQQREGGTVHYIPGPPQQGGPPPPQQSPSVGIHGQQAQHLQMQQQQQLQREQQFLEESYGNPEMMSAMAAAQQQQQQQQQQQGRRMVMGPPQPGGPQQYEMRFDAQGQMYSSMPQQDMPPQFYEQQVLEQQFMNVQPGSPASQEAALALQQQQQQADFLYQQQLQQQMAAQQQQQQQQPQHPGLQPQLPDSISVGGNFGGMPPVEQGGYGYGPGAGGYTGEYMGGPQQQEFVAQQQPWLS